MRDEKMAACLWVPRFWPAMGGTELHTHELAKRLSSEFQVNVITHCITDEVKGVSLMQDAISASDCLYVDSGVTVNRVCVSPLIRPSIMAVARLQENNPILRPAYSGMFLSALYAKTAGLTRNMDLIHFVYNGLTDSAMLASITANRHKIPFVFTPNILDTSDSTHAWNSRRFMNLYAKASHIIALTLHEAEWLKNQGVCGEKISVVPYGPILQCTSDAGRFRKLIQSGTAKIVLFLGRVNITKGYDLLLDACQELWSTHPDTRIVFMGPATSIARSSISRMGDARIVLLESFDQQVKTDALSACDVLCVPSRMESLGVVYIEAAYQAKPVVALNLPVLRDVIEHGKTGLLIEESKDELVRAVRMLLDNPEKAEQMGRYGQCLAVNRYNWVRVSRCIGEIYRELVIPGRRKRAQPVTR